MGPRGNLRIRPVIILLFLMSFAICATTLISMHNDSLAAHDPGLPAASPLAPGPDAEPAPY